MVDSIGHPAHLHYFGTILALVSRAPLASIERFRQRMGWPLPWYSSSGSDFNYDFHTSFDEDIAPLEYNYMDEATLERTAPYIRSGGTLTVRAPSCARATASSTPTRRTGAAWIS